MAISNVTEYAGQLPQEGDQATFSDRSAALFAWLVQGAMPEFNVSVTELNAALNGEAGTLAAVQAVSDALDALQLAFNGLGNASAFDEASAANYRAKTADKILSPVAVWGAAVDVSLTDAATVSIDLANGINFDLTLGGNRTLGNPTSQKVGQAGFIITRQDATGGRTLSFSGNWKFAGGAAPTLSTATGAVDILFYQVIALNFVMITNVLDVK